ncbi:TetR/AcrR family transcriptional regulator [Actinomadura alba]|uniref:TetR family transcriptional regulator n=1 Tax=Actinomadura alba TaxID=406431 RepID=A0ABR7LVR9_9ACTN|nr:TetR family transcriptional regulator [Actinomadura alba]MBC6468950.1 TetR family transcriptional regulator [Actinomadura alba]
MTTDIGDQLGEAGRSGLRARKKLATREALSRAALRLALERGLQNVRVDDIAAEAGVSPRTYNNYFSSREEAICFLSVQRAQRIGAALRARPPEEPLAEAIGHAMAEEYAGRSEPDKVTMRMFISEPALRGEYLKGLTAVEGPLAEAIAARTGTDPERDLFPRVLAAAVTSAARTATRHYLRTETTAPFAAVVRDAIELIAPAARAHEGRRA